MKDFSPKIRNKARMSTYHLHSTKYQKPIQCNIERKINKRHSGWKIRSKIVSNDATCMCNHVQLFVTPWTLALQTSLSMGFPRQEYWSGLPFPSSGNIPNPGIELLGYSQPRISYVSWITDIRRVLYQLRQWGSPINRWYNCLLESPCNFNEKWS